MKDKNLRKALGIHGSEENLCGCDVVVPEAKCPTIVSSWHGEIPMLWRKVKELENKIKALEDKGKE